MLEWEKHSLQVQKVQNFKRICAEMYLEGAAPRPAGEDCNADGDGLCRRNALEGTLRGPANPAF
jgi:hypothetical protein